ncbi:hypothetical protein [Euzebya pacifica]|uniref:hypothetical protein n=1 Tax=Euzebya pacifica TaxID=1608957 RepID=UPI0030FB9FFC
MRRSAKPLLDKALSSLRRPIGSFNGLDDDGRTTSVLLHLQHAFEMLLKAGLEQRRVRLFERSSGRSKGMDKCINLAQEHLQLTDEEAGTIRAIDALRDEEQHWFAQLDEGLLYTHVVAGVSLFAELLKRSFPGTELREHLPSRVLPIATEPPRDVQFFINRQFEEVKRLLQPGSRRQADARAHIRSLLAMEAHEDEDADVSDKDVRRVVRGVQQGKSRDEVFPRLGTLGSHAEGEGIELRVTMVRNDQQDAVPFNFVGDDGADAVAVRERDLQKRYKWSRSALNERFGLGTGRGKALRIRAGVEDDERYVHEFSFGKTSHLQYSDEALTQMQRTLDEVGIDTIWADYRSQA